MKTLKFTDGEAAMFVELLDRADMYLSNAGCNDFDLSAFKLSPDEMRSLVREYHRENGDPEEAEGYSDGQLRYALPDMCALSLLRWRLLGGRKAKRAK